ncbi:MAG: hypothetical protein M3Y87_09135 [Myxococcota bacterium]|nr:hypothetical protein [Myxococcota bacterium]
MCTTKLSVMVALSLLALGLGPGAPVAHAQEHAQDLTFPALQYAAPTPLETTRAEAYRAERGRSLGLGIAGIATGAVGIVIGGPVLLIAGTTRTHCSGSLWSGTHSCASLPDNTGSVVGGALSIGVGFVAVITGIVLIATRPRRPGPTLSFGGDSTSVSISIDGTF